MIVNLNRHYAGKFMKLPMFTKCNYRPFIAIVENEADYDAEYIIIMTLNPVSIVVKHENQITEVRITELEGKRPASIKDFVDFVITGIIVRFIGEFHNESDRICEEFKKTLE